MTTSAKQTKGLIFKRQFSQEGTDPFDQKRWGTSSVSITDGDRVVFTQDAVEAPADWSPLAIKIAVSKYFHGDIRKGTDPKTGGRETSIRQLIHRVVHTIRTMGQKDGYFATKEDADIFEQDLKWLCVNQYGAFNSPVWFNVGLYHEYGFGNASAEGNYIYNRETGRAARPKTQYEYPQGSACLPYRGRINTTKGLIPIGELVRRFNRGESFDGFDRDGGTTPVIAAICNGKRRTGTVRFTNGTSLDLTSDHVFFIQCEDGMVERQMKDLRPGDLCVLSRDILVNRGVPTTFELSGQTFTMDDAWMAGVMIGNGFSGRSPSSTSDTWELKVNTVEQRDRAVKAATEAMLPHAVQEFHWGFVIRGYGEAGRSYWEALGVWNKTNNKEMPEWVFRAKQTILSAVLRGLFDSDGHVSIDPNDRRGVELSNTSEQVVQSAAQLLHSMGIFCSLSAYEDPRDDGARKTTYYLKIQDVESANRFSLLVGFTHTEKRATLSGLRATEDKDYRKSLLEVQEVELGRFTELVYDIQTRSGTFWYQGVLVHNCFIQSVSDNMESIMALATSEAMLFKFGSGTGTDLSTLRSSKERLSGGGTPSGPLSFLAVYDAVAGVVKSGGKTRRAAKMNTLKVHHPDIEEFINAKPHEEKKAWALIEAGYNASFNGEAYGTVRFQNENLSVRATDEFMIKALIPEDDDRGLYDTIAVTTGQPIEKKHARTMLRKIAEGTHLCGDPGMQFEDTIQTWHTCAGTEPQNSTNPCCFVGETLVDTSEGPISIEALTKMDTRGEKLPLAFSFDFENNLPCLRQIKKAWVAGHTSSLIEVRTDKGVVLRCTPEHRFYLYDGSTIEAQDLAPGMRLRKIGRWANESRSGRRSLNHRETEDAPNGTSIMSRWMWEQVHGPIPEGMEVHHKNGNPTDDRMENFELRQEKDHRSEHSAGQSNPRFIEVSDAKLLTVWEGVEKMPRITHKSKTGVTPVRWNNYVMIHGLTGQVPMAASPTKQGRIQGMTWAEFTEKMEGLKCAANDTVQSATIVTLEKEVSVFDLEVEETHNFGVMTPDHLHSIIVSNSEYLFLDNTACNLASLNLMKFRDDAKLFDTEKFRAAVRLFITAQDIIVDNASYPTAAIAVNSHIFRTLGLGFANLGALLMSFGLPYDSKEGRTLASCITSIMTGESYSQSAFMAQALGPFEGLRDASCYNVKPLKPDNLESMNRVISQHEEKAKSIDVDSLETAFGTDVAKRLYRTSADAWKMARMVGETYGYRNAQVTVLAPTGTIGFLMDCDTTGIEPGIALVSYKLLAGGGTLKLVNGTVNQGLQKLGYSDLDVRRIQDHIAKHDTIEDVRMTYDKAIKEMGLTKGDYRSIIDSEHDCMVISGLKPEHLPVFDCAFKPQNGTRSLNFSAHILMMAACQPFLSGAISKTVNLPEEATVEDIMNTYIEGWRLGLKAIAIYRDGSKRSAPLNVKSITENKADDAVESEEIKGLREYIATLEAAHGEPVRRKMPDDRAAHTHKFEIGGHKGYLTVGMFPDGTLGELFVQMNKEGSTIGGLMDTVATLTSMALQYGVPLESLVKKFAYQRFEPSGYTKNPDIRSATSITDYIFRYLGCRFIPGYREQTAAKPHYDGGLAHSRGESPVPPPTPSKAEVSGPASFYLPDPCGHCGSAKVVRAGACGVCTFCGSSAGCS